MSNQELLILLGTHGFSIHSVFFDPIKKRLRQGESTKTSEDPSWLTRHPTIPDIVYSNGHVEGKMFALRSKGSDGSLDILSEAKTGGYGPTHIVIHPQAGAVLAHYKTGNVSTIPLNPDGTLSSTSHASMFTAPPTNFLHPRQEAPHAHQVVLHEESGDLFVPDLGSNKVWRLRWDVSKNEFKEVEGGNLEGFEDGDGPRHMVFHPDGKHAYTLAELSSTIIIHDLSSPSSPLDRFSILPPYDTENGNGPKMLASEILLCPPLKQGDPILLIASNRDSPNPKGDALALFSVDAKDGSKVIRAETRPWIEEQGHHLRGVAVDKTGKWVVVTCRNGGGVIMFERKGNGTEMVEVDRIKDIEKTVCPLWMD